MNHRHRRRLIAFAADSNVSSSIDDDEEVEAADVEVEVDHGTAGGDEAAEDTYLLEYHDLPIAAVVAAVVGACAFALHRRWRRRRAKLSTFSV